MLAILVSGSIRNFFELWPKNQDIIENLSIPYSVFIHTWSNNYDTFKNVIRDGNAHKFYLNLNQLEYKKQEFNVKIEDFKKIKLLKDIKIDKFCDKEYYVKYNINIDGNKDLEQSLVNSIAMYDGMKRVAELFNKHKNDYQYFIRLRTDFLLDKKSLIDFTKNDFSFLGPITKTNYGSVCDQSFGGLVNPYLSLMYSFDTYNSVINMKGFKQENGQYFYAERVLAKHIYDLFKDLKVKKNNFPGKIVRPEVIKVNKVKKIKFFQQLMTHNFRVLVSKLIQIISKLARKFNHNVYL